MAKNVDITNIQTSLDLEKIDSNCISPDQLPTSIYDAIVTSAQRFGDRTAIEYILDGDCISPNAIPFSKKIVHGLLKTFKGKSFAAPYRTMSYQTLASQVTQMANALEQLGVNRTDVTSIISPNFPEMYVSLWGAETAGIANPVNPLLESSIIKEILISANTKVLIALGPVPGSDICQKTLEIKEHIPSLKAVISLFGDDMPADANNKVPVYSFEKLLAKQSGTTLTATKPDQADICSYFHTGGTTGLPKLAKHLHLNEITNAAQINAISPVQSGDTMLVGLPIFHVNAAIATGLASVMGGCKILLVGPSGFRGKNVVNNLLSLINNYNVAFMTAVPTVYAGLLESLAKSTSPISKPPSMKLALCGAAPLSTDLQNKFKQVTGISLVEGYGSTEGSAVSTLMPVNPICKRAAVGLALPEMSIKIGDIDEDGNLIRLCDVDESGEILISGNNVFPGYVEDSHNENLMVTTDDGITYVRTGDLGLFDEHGYLSLSGRKKELIIRGGHNIDPKMIEDAATKHEEVVLAAAVPRPDSYAGELPVLYVTLAQSSTLTVEQLTQHMKTHIAERAALPKSIHILEEMPLTAVGKLFKPALVCDEIYKVIESTLKEHYSNTEYSIKVSPDKKKGINAIITFTNDKALENIQEQVKQLFTPYSFNYQITQTVNEQAEVA